MKLAGHLKMTLRELCDRMDSREFSLWLAFHRYHEPLPEPWYEAGMVASAAIAPYCRPGNRPKASDFVPIASTVKHETQISDELKKLSEALGGQQEQSEDG
ncbi:MAG: phage tail assembly protein T [Pirellulales bacterium]